jgi:hypothetical protein
MRGLVSAFIYLLICVVLISVPSLAPNKLPNLAFGTISLATLTMLRGLLLSGAFLFVLLSIKDCLWEINFLINERDKKQLFLPFFIFAEVFLLEYIIAAFGSIFCEIIASLSPIASPGTDLANSYWLAYMRNLPFQTITFQSETPLQFAKIAGMCGWFALMHIGLKVILGKTLLSKEQ